MVQPARMDLALAMLEPKIERLLDALDSIAEATCRSADALEQIVAADRADKGDGSEPDIDIGRLDGIGSSS